MKEPRLEPLADKVWERVEKMTYSEVLAELDERGEVWDEQPTEEEAMNHLYELMEMEE